MRRKISAREARQKFSQVLDWVAAGDEVVLLRRGEEIGVITRGRRPGTAPLPDLTEFRNSIQVKGLPASEEIIQMRREARY